MPASHLKLIDQQTATDKTPQSESKLRAAPVSPKEVTKRRTSSKKSASTATPQAKKKTTAPQAAETASTAKKRTSPVKQSSTKKSATKRAASAADVMTQPAVACGLHDNLNDAARLLWEHDLGSLVVVDHDGAPVSMITDRDICMGAYTQGVPLSACQVSTSMSKELVSCAAGTPLDEVRDRMAAEQVRRMPVVNDAGQLVGIIGWSDVMREAAAPLPKDRKRGSTAPAVMQLFDAILSPVE